MKRVLVTEALDDQALEILQGDIAVDVRLGLSPEELVDAIGDYEALIVRSKTEVTQDVIKAGTRLEIIGRAGVGVDNIDLRAATRRGIIVVNVPAGNTIAVAEHTIGLMLALARHITDANATMHQRRWEKKRLTGFELRNKTLGLIGLGKIGTAVAQRAQCMEMRVVACDPFVSPELASRLKVELASIDELLQQADIISIHTPLTAHTRQLIDAAALAKVKPTACIINCARGGIIDEGSLAKALQEGRLAGAALDVFEHEPLESSPLQGDPRVILTPHLGAATHEAQLAVAIEVAEQIRDALAGGIPRYPVNAAFLSQGELAESSPYMELAQRLGSFYAQRAEASLSRLDITYGGEMGERNTELLRAALLVGLLSGASQEPVNLINAAEIARARGIVIAEHREPEAENLEELLTLSATTTQGESTVAGTILRGKPHIVRIDDFWVDFCADGQLLVSSHTEQPGIFGRMGTLLGDADINIRFVQVGRKERGGEGVMIVGIDDDITEKVLAQVLEMPSIRTARVIKLGDSAFDEMGPSG